MKGKFEQSRVPKPNASAAPKKPQPPKPKKAPAVPKSPKAKKKSSKTPLIIVGALVAILVVGVLAYGLILSSSNTILSGLKVAGVSVGGLSQEEAVAAVNQQVGDSYRTSDVVINLPDQTVTLLAADLAVDFDVEGAVAQAYSYGKDGSIFDAIAQKFADDADVDSIIMTDYMTFDHDYVDTTLSDLAASVGSAKTDSSYEISEDNRTITVHVGTSQRELDVEPIAQQVTAAIFNNDYTPISAAYTESSYSPVDLQTLYNQLCSGTVDAYYDTATKSVIPEVVGYGFDVEAANQQQMMAQEGTTLSFQISEIYPTVTAETLSAQLFTDVLGAYSGAHVYNTARTTNLQLSAEAINGTILNPGEEFSFNNIVGERTAAKGYQAASVYVNSETVSELGGGVCQVASTIYMATLLADLQVTERTEHMYLVTYVPMGMDATIYWGALDYKFKNTSDYPIKVMCEVKDGYVNVEILGQSTTDRYVEMTYEVLSTTAWTDVQEVDETKEPGYSSVSVTPYTGYTVQTYKYYVDGDGNRLTENEKVAYSIFKVRNKVTIVGPEVAEEETTLDTDGADTTDTTTDATTDTSTDTSTDTTTDTSTDTSTDTTTDTSTDTTTDTTTTESETILDV